jgi:hypothetical protein
MKKIVVFTEGRGELIFMRHLLLQMVGNGRLSIQCLELHSDQLRPASYQLSVDNPSVYSVIISVGTDEKVLSEIVEQYQGYLDKGFQIIGIRDMYSKQYEERLRLINHENNETIAEVNNYFIDKARKIINSLDNHLSIHLFFAIMELEAWFLGMYDTLERINPALTADRINNELGFDLRVIDPETSFFHPSVDFSRVLHLAGIGYGKHVADMERIVSTITLDDIELIANENRCNSFALLFSEIQRELEEA